MIVTLIKIIQGMRNKSGSWGWAWSLSSSGADPNNDSWSGSLFRSGAESGSRSGGARSRSRSGVSMVGSWSRAGSRLVFNEFNMLRSDSVLSQLLIDICNQDVSVLPILFDALEDNIDQRSR